MSTPANQVSAANASSVQPVTGGIVAAAKADIAKVGAGIKTDVAKISLKEKLYEAVAAHYVKVIFAGVSYAVGHLVGNSTIGNLIAKLF